MTPSNRRLPLPVIPGLVPGPIAASICGILPIPAIRAGDGPRHKAGDDGEVAANAPSRPFTRLPCGITVTLPLWKRTCGKWNQLVRRASASSALNAVMKPSTAPRAPAAASSFESGIMSSLSSRTASRFVNPVPGFAWSASLVGLCVILLAPLLLIEVPPLLDYPNHPPVSDQLPPG